MNDNSSGRTVRGGGSCACPGVFFKTPSLCCRSPESAFRHVEFDKTRPFLALPTGVMTAFNSQNTVFYHSAFWGLLLPITTRFREDDIWRGCALSPALATWPALRLGPTHTPR